MAHAGEHLVRAELCDEALRLAHLVAARPITAQPEVDALLALMHLVRARAPARVDADGRLLPLAAQDRRAWDRAHLTRGLLHLERSACGERVTRYHLEAEIAACHAAAPAVEATDWARVLALYDDLLAQSPSPVVALNRAVALGRVHGPEAAIAALEPLRGDPALARYHLLPATLGDLWLELGRSDEAAACFRAALERPCSAPERRFIEARLTSLQGG